MRVLLKDDDGSLHCIEVTEISWDGDLTELGEKYDVFQQGKVEGLLFYDMNNDYYAIKDISQSTANSLIKRAAMQGWIDLSSYEYVDGDDLDDLIKKNKKSIL